MTQLIPREVLFGNPERTSPRLSPDGTRLAWIAPHDGVLNVWVAPAPAGDLGAPDWSAAAVVTDDSDRGIRTFGWAYDNRHVLYLQDAGGDENWRLYDVDLETMERRDLTPFDGVQVQLIGLHPSRPREVLLGINLDNPQLHDVYRLDLETAELVKEEENPGFRLWVADGDLVVRAALASEPDGSFVLMTRPTPREEWRRLADIPADDGMSTMPETIAGSGPNARLIAISSVGAETARLLAVDLQTGEIDVLADDPEVDVTGVRTHPLTHEPQIATITRDRAEYAIVDQAVADDLEQIHRLHPGDPVFAGGDVADDRWVIGFTTDDGPVTYFLFDRTSREGRFLFDSQPALAAYELSPMEPFELRSRDGLTLHGYATFPHGAGRQDLPTVLFVHGGPWSRDTWGYSAEAQWLANRGYLCLQVNFRGSTGYGKSFLSAGDREWGGKMQDDLTDTVEFAIAQGWSDADRVAIFGGSYGGYAVLAGAAFTPDLYCCGVDIVGPSNIKTLLETIPPYWAPIVAQFHRRMGNPETDAEFLESRSPLFAAKEIKIPLLIAQGANDPRVKQAESEQIVRALEEAGIDHEYMVFPDEGHGFAKPENRLVFFAAAEKFLARHLGGRFEE